MMLWSAESNLWLFTPEELAKLPDGIKLEDINGDFAIKGVDYVDDDTRAGHLAYGIRDFKNNTLVTLLK